MFNRKHVTTIALVALVAWACSPDDYPTEPRFEVPDVIELPDGELFFYVPPAGVTVSAVSVRGAFNEWGETPMTELSDGRWVAGIELAPGTYEYKYFFNNADWAGNMCNDGTWGDPANGGKVDPAVTDCLDGGNGLRTVGTPGYTFLYYPRADKDVEVVTVAGTFQPGDGWNNQSDTLFNVWTLTVDMPAGTHQYKYVFNDGDWAESMCNEPQWGDSINGYTVDPDNPVCVSGGGDGELVIDEAGPYTFRYIRPANVSDSIAAIHIAGSFQGWNNNSPDWNMVETFQRTYVIEPRDDGSPHEYKFIFDGNWATNMCTDTGGYGDPETGLVDANNTDGCHDGGNAFLQVE